ncbi:MAG: RsmG family class I SAM-dependent methyltransferase, partial [Nocardioides sp.]
VEVVRGRAEGLHGRRTWDVVTARAVAPLERLAGWCLPLAAAGGELVAMKGAGAQAEVEASWPALRELGCERPVVAELGTGVLEVPTWVVRVARPENGPVGWRGRAGDDGRRPSTTQRRKK